MSSRAMRKLCNDPDIILDAKAVNDEEDGEDVDDLEGDGEVTEQSALRNTKKKKKKKKVVNPFELLNDIDTPVEEEGVAEGSAGDEKLEHLPNGTETGDQPSLEGKSKKKRKKKKKKQGAKTEPQEDEDEIDASIREVNELLQSNPQLSASSAVSADHGSRAGHAKPLLGVEHKHLNPENELRRIFGANVVKNEQRQRGRNRAYQKSSWLVTPKSTWPKMSKTGLSMQHLTSEGRYEMFTFEHSKDYQTAQFDFLDAVESMNPGNIMEIVNRYPYHVDSLLQLSEISRMNDDTGTAVDLMERALYTCECAFHTLFGLAEGNCQLEYKRSENRGFFLALFKHLTYLGQKGCNRTALEFSKLLLALEPSKDPLGVLLMIDYYALKTDQFDFLIKIFEEWDAHRNLSLLPNWAFSIAMAHFYNINSSSTSSLMTASMSSSAAAASSSSSASSSEKPDTSRADSMLQDALLMFPSVLLALLEKCSIQPDAAIANHPFFNAQKQSGKETALPQLVALFVARNYSFWKESDSMSWLERNAREVVNRVDAKDPKAADYREKRESRYVGMPLNIYRHIFLSEHLGVKLTLPPELASTPMMSYDPLPPKDSVTSYTRPPSRPPRPTRASGGVFAEFLRSIVPSYVPPNPGDYVDFPEDANDADLGAAGGYLHQNSNLRQGVGAVMDAMRDLLQTLEPLNRQDGEQEDPQLEEFD